MLVTLDDTKTRLGILLTDTSQDVYLNGEIALFSESVENYCNRKFEVATYVEKIFHADFYNTMYHLLYHFPIISVSSVVEKAKDENDTALFHTVNNRTGKFNIVDDYDYRTRLFTNTGRNGYIDITYDAGYVTVPLEIQESIFSLIEARYNKKESGVALNFGSNVQRISVPGVMGIDFDYTLSTNDRDNKYGMILGDYLNVFANYRSERTLVGESEVSFI